MPLVVTLVILMVLVATGGYYIGPGIGHYGASAICALLLLLILYRVFASGRKRKGMHVTSELEGPPESPSRR